MKKIILSLIFLISIKEVYTQIEIKIDTSIFYQTFSGWESASSITSECDPNFEKLRDEILPYLIDSIGITRLRLEVRSGSENTTDHYQIWLDNKCPSGTDTNYQKWRANRYATINDNLDTTINPNGFIFTELDNRIERVILPFNNLLKQRGLSPFINLCYVAFTSQIKNGNYIHDNPDEYAEFVLAVYLHMYNKYGFIPDTWEILLEPDNVSQWNANLLGQAIIKSAERLKKYGFRPRFIAPSNTNMTNAVKYFDEMIKVPGALDYLEEISYHRYAGVSQKSLKEIADRGIQYGKKTSMLEWWFDNAKYNILHEDITTGNVSSFQQATISGFFNINNTNPQNPIISIKDISQYNRIYYTLIKPGAVRKGAITSNQIVSPVFIQNIDENYNLILKVDSDTMISINEIPNGSYSVLVTNDEKKYQIIDVINVQNNSISKYQVEKGLIAFKQIKKFSSVEGKKNIETILINSISDYIDIKPQSESSEIIIYSSFGECVIKLSHSFSEGEVVRIDVSKLASGMYFVRIGDKVSKFVKI